MILFKPYKIEKSALDSTPIKEGQFIICTDSKEIYLDKSDTERIKISNDIDITNFQTIDNLTTELTENSTNTQYPGAKTVFDALKNAGGGAGVHIGPEAPTDDSEVWIDTDENGNSASGMYVGADEPIDPAIEVWIDTDEEPTTIPTKISELENDSNFITSNNISNIWVGTQEEYDAIEIKTETTMYYIKEG